MEVVLFDAHGIASGGSGAAAGLLHPYSPKGKASWGKWQSGATMQGSRGEVNPAISPRQCTRACWQEFGLAGAASFLQRWAGERLLVEVSLGHELRTS